MTIIVILAVITVGGLYLRWATGPVLTAYRVGRQVERMLATINRSGAEPGRAGPGRRRSPVPVPPAADGRARTGGYLARLN
jgi:hypothetical protein